MGMPYCRMIQGTGGRRHRQHTSQGLSSRPQCGQVTLIINIQRTLQGFAQTPVPRLALVALADQLGSDLKVHVVVPRLMIKMADIHLLEDIGLIGTTGGSLPQLRLHECGGAKQERIAGRLQIDGKGSIRVDDRSLVAGRIPVQVGAVERNPPVAGIDRLDDRSIAPVGLGFKMAAGRIGMPAQVDHQLDRGPGRPVGINAAGHLHPGGPPGCAPSIPQGERLEVHTFALYFP